MPNYDDFVKTHGGKDLRYMPDNSCKIESYGASDSDTLIIQI